MCATLADYSTLTCKRAPLLCKAVSARAEDMPLTQGPATLPSDAASNQPLNPEHMGTMALGQPLHAHQSAAFKCKEWAAGQLLDAERLHLTSCPAVLQCNPLGLRGGGRMGRSCQPQIRSMIMWCSEVRASPQHFGVGVALHAGSSSTAC